MGCFEVISMYVLSSKKINPYSVVKEQRQGQTALSFFVSVENNFLVIVIPENYPPHTVFQWVILIKIISTRFFD
jgi:hypothetical protein